MALSRIEQAVYDQAAPICRDLGLELVTVSFAKEQGSWFLRVFIDKPGGVELDDCQAVSERLGEYLDREDPIEQSYYMEVSSPGINRPLIKQEDYQRFAGERVEIKTYKTIDGQKVFRGRLRGLEEGKVLVELPSGQVVQIPWEMVSRGRLDPEISFK